MRKYWIMLALCLAACCGGAELKPFHGDNYILDCRSGIAISVKQKNGDFVPASTRQTRTGRRSSVPPDSGRSV